MANKMNKRELASLIKAVRTGKRIAEGGEVSEEDEEDEASATSSIP